MSEPFADDIPQAAPQAAPADILAPAPVAPFLPPTQKLAKGWVFEPVFEKEPEPAISLDAGRAHRNKPRVNYAIISSPRVTSPVASASTKKRAKSTKKVPKAPAAASADALQVGDIGQTIASLQNQIDLIGGQVQADAGPPKKKPRTTPAKSATEHKSGVRPIRSTAGKKAQPAAPTIRGRGQGPSPVMKQCARILQKMMKHRHAHPFLQPVDPMLLQIPDYFDIIKIPMDFGTINHRLEAGLYGDPQEFADDVRLVFANCRLYNAAQSDIVKMGNLIETEAFEPEWAKMPKFQADLVSKATNLELKQQLSQLTGAMLAVQQQMASLTQAASLHSPATGAPAESPRAAARPAASGAARRRAPPTMSFEEKRWLSDQITMLEHEPLVTVVQIIHESHPFEKNAEGVAPDIIEIDIDSLDTNALRKLMTYVKKVTGKQPPTRRKSTAAPAKRGSPSASPLPAAAAPAPATSETADSTSVESTASAQPLPQPVVDNATTAVLLAATTPSAAVATEVAENLDLATPAPAPVAAAPVEDDDDASYSSETDSSTSDDDDQSFEAFSKTDSVIFGKSSTPAASTGVSDDIPKILDAEGALPQKLEMNPDRWSNLGRASADPSKQTSTSTPAGWGDFLQKRQLEEQRTKERQEREEQRERERLELVEGRRRDEELRAQQEQERDQAQRAAQLQAFEETQRQRDEARERAKLQRAQQATTVDALPF